MAVVPAEVSEILSKVDHTLLRQDASWEEIARLCDEAMYFGTASVCIPPSYVRQASDYIRNAYESTGRKRVAVCTVIGFPNGYATTESKAFEAYDAVKNGADEIDMVINVGSAKAGRFGDILHEINIVGNAVSGHILKVIIETCLLSEYEKERMCEVVSTSYADFIKTSTGFSTGGATLDDVKLLKAHMKNGKRVKASGGIPDIAAAKDFLTVGADRLGTSRVVKDAIQKYGDIL